MLTACQCPGGAQAYREGFGEVHFLSRDPEGPGKCSHMLWAQPLPWTGGLCYPVVSENCFSSVAATFRVTSFYLHSTSVVWG